MRSVVLGLTAALLLAGPTLAQTSTANPPRPATQTSTVNPPTSGTPAATSDRNAASGNDNQAVATTYANATRPAHGHNSFSRGEARGRIAAQG